MHPPGRSPFRVPLLRLPFVLRSIAAPIVAALILVADPVAFLRGQAQVQSPAPSQTGSQPQPPARPPEALVVPDYVAPPVQRLAGRTLRTYEAREATQGVAADARFFYAIANTVLAKYEIASGRLADRWVSPRNGLIRHLNSCLVDAGRLWCANSNYALTPMGSSVEIFDTASLDHADSHSLGMRDEGSVTWFDRYGGGWIAGFAHYSGTGGVPFKNHTFSSVVAFDAEWRRTGGWLFPESAIERMAPHAASGGALGPDGWLYLLGHDRPEMYVVAKPSMGPTLIHLATIDLEAEGQAFSWAQDGTRTIFTIDRRKGLVRTIEVPPIAPAGTPDAVPFRQPRPSPQPSPRGRGEGDPTPSPRAAGRGLG